MLRFSAPLFLALHTLLYIFCTKSGDSEFLFWTSGFTLRVYFILKQQVDQHITLFHNTYIICKDEYDFFLSASHCYIFFLCEEEISGKTY